MRKNTVLYKNLGRWFCTLLMGLAAAGSLSAQASAVLPATGFPADSAVLSAGTLPADTPSAGTAQTAQPAAGDAPARPLVYTFEMKREVGPALLRMTRQAFDEAVRLHASLVVVHMNTYGGQLDAADSIRTRLLQAPMPVYVFVDNNAISAGALIATAASRIYMCDGAALGAATVVNQSGEPMPDKYQSFMRALMRTTAESHGRDTLVADGDTIVRWRRDPLIAEAMVTAGRAVDGVQDSSRVLTLTTDEAIRLHWCEGRAESIGEVLSLNGLENAEVHAYSLTPLERFIGWLVNPALQGVLILFMVGGIYFEFKVPGTLLPLGLAALAALFYFAPLYLEGLAAHWEMLLFVAGVVLMALEIFVIPGFGVAGVSGALCMTAGLTLSLIDNVVFSWDFSYAIGVLCREAALVAVSLLAAVLCLLWAGPRFLRRTSLQGVALHAEQAREEGFVSVSFPEHIQGTLGTALTMLRPSGKVLVNGCEYDAMARHGYISKGDTVKVVRAEAGQLYVDRMGA